MHRNIKFSTRALSVNPKEVSVVQPELPIQVRIQEYFEETNMVRGEINLPVKWIKTIKSNATEFEIYEYIFGRAVSGTTNDNSSN